MMTGIDMSGVGVVRKQFAKLVDTTRKTLESQDDSVISCVLETIDVPLDAPRATDHDVEVISEQAKKLLNALSRSGLHNRKKLELSEMARKVWEGWKVNMNDIEFERKPSGDRKRIGKGGAAEVYLANMKRRNEKDHIIAGEHVEVAVKQFTVPRSKFKRQFPQFMREVFLQKHAQHPCIVRTFGGYWPDAEEVAEEDDIEPCIVMERMSHNLRQIQDKQLLKSLDSKRRVLRDIAAGIEHLHSWRIVHRDIKPENVLMRVVDGRIIGRAKVCDFGVSRKAEGTDLMTHTTQEFTRPTGSSLYMPPEAFNNSARDASKRARDIWSFGVLMCEVLDPAFLSNLVDEHPGRMFSMEGRTEFAKKVIERALTISCDWILEHILASCLLVNPILRPRIEDLRARMENDADIYQFHFDNYYSWQYRANEIQRYVRKCFDVEAHRKNIHTGIVALEQAARDNVDISAQSVLGYCHYYGIGVERDEKKAIALFQKGCNAGDDMGMFAMGTVHHTAGRFDKAVSLLTKAANSGNTGTANLGSSGAQGWLAECCRIGEGLRKDAKRAFQLLSFAAEAGNEEAEVNLAVYFKDGNGTKEDERKAISMLHRLSASGNALACMTLALWCKEGYGMKKDEEMAKQFLVLARKRGIVGSWVVNERNEWIISGN